MISRWQPGTTASISVLIFSSVIFTRRTRINVVENAPDARIVWRLKIVGAISGYNKLTGFGFIQVPRPVIAGQDLFIDLSLQGHKCVNQGLRTRGAARNVHVYGNIAIDSFQD